MRGPLNAPLKWPTSINVMFAIFFRAAVYLVPEGSVITCLTLVNVYLINVKLATSYPFRFLPLLGVLLQLRYKFLINVVNEKRLPESVALLASIKSCFSFKVILKPYCLGPSSVECG